MKQLLLLAVLLWGGVRYYVEEFFNQYVHYSTDEEDTSPITTPDSDCGVPQVKAGRLMLIVGGRRVEYRGKWPWLVSIRRSDGLHWCGGSLIGPYTVLSAAHCFIGWRSSENYTVLLGAYDLSRPEVDTQVISISNVTKADNFRSEYNPFYVVNDIAIVTLSRAANFSDYVIPVCLPEVEGQFQDCVMAGWGHTTYQGSSGLQFSEQTVSFLPLDICQERIASIQFFRGVDWLANSSSLCTLATNQAKVCKGDSGSPLMCHDRTTGQWHLAGVVSWSITICIAMEFPSIFTDVSKYNDWIVQHLETTNVTT